MSNNVNTWPLNCKFRRLSQILGWPSGEGFARNLFGICDKGAGVWIHMKSSRSSLALLLWSFWFWIWSIKNNRPIARTAVIFIAPGWPSIGSTLLISVIGRRTEFVKYRTDFSVAAYAFGNSTVSTIVYPTFSTRENSIVCTSPQNGSKFSSK